MFAIKCVNFLASKLIQHVIAIGQSEILIQAYICNKMCQFSSIKVDSTCNLGNTTGSIRNLEPKNIQRKKSLIVAA